MNSQDFKVGTKCFLYSDDPHFDIFSGKVLFNFEPSEYTVIRKEYVKPYEILNLCTGDDIQKGGYYKLILKNVYGDTREIRDYDRSICSSIEEYYERAYESIEKRIEKAQEQIKDCAKLNKMLRRHEKKLTKKA